MIKKALEFFRTVTMPQAMVVVALVAGGVTLALLMPDDRWTLTVRVLAGLITSGGVAGTLLLERKGSPHSLLPPPMDPVSLPPVPTYATPPVPRRRPRKEGAASIDFVLAVVVVVGAFILAPLFSGCAGAALAAKPFLDTSCAAARVTCRLINSACSYYEDSVAPMTEAELSPSSGGEAEASPPAEPAPVASPPVAEVAPVAEDAPL